MRNIINFAGSLLIILISFLGCNSAPEIPSESTPLPTATKVPISNPFPSPTITPLPSPTTDPKITVHPPANLDGNESDLIAFQIYNYDENSQTYFLVRPDGSNLTELVTLSGGFDRKDYSWSPDGSKIAFSHAPTEGIINLDYVQLYSVDIYSREIFRITNETANHTNPVWSPDGSRIAFKIGEDYLLASVAAGGGAEVTLSMNSNISANYAWSPDGSQIAVSIGSPPFDFSIWLMDANGDNLHQIEFEYLDMEADYTYSTLPVWMPDGDHLVFLKQHDLYYGDIEGKSSTRLTFTVDRPELYFDVSPDGSMVAFLIYDVGDVSLNIIDLHGNMIVEKVFREASVVEFDWANDSSAIVLTVDKQLWLYSVEDQSLIKILDCPGNCQNPQWQP